MQIFRSITTVPGETTLHFGADRQWPNPGQRDGYGEGTGAGADRQYPTPGPKPSKGGGSDGDAFSPMSGRRIDPKDCIRKGKLVGGQGVQLPDCCFLVDISEIPPAHNYPERTTGLLWNAFGSAFPDNTFDVFDLGQLEKNRSRGQNFPLMVRVGSVGANGLNQPITSNPAVAYRRQWEALNSEVVRNPTGKILRTTMTVTYEETPPKDVPPDLVVKFSPAKAEGIPKGVKALFEHCPLQWA